MFFAVRAGAPRMAVFTGSAIATLGRSVGLGGSAGTPPRPPGALGLTSWSVMASQLLAYDVVLVGLAAEPLVRLVPERMRAPTS